MTGGILVADMIEGGTRFALGVSMALRRGAFAKAGGYEAWGSTTPRTLCWDSGWRRRGSA